MTNKPLSASRRLGPRRVTDVMVFASDGREIRQCRLRDISLDGAFIEIENFALVKGTKLDLVLRILREEKTTACPLPAEVVRVEKDGAALMFGGLDQHVYNILVDIVLASQNHLRQLKEWNRAASRAASFVVPPLEVVPKALADAAVAVWKRQRSR